MKLADLPTPCLVLDRGILVRNIGAMAHALLRHGVPLRPHMKTAKSIEVARLATMGQQGGITVSTLAEAEYFSRARHRRYPVRRRRDAAEARPGCQAEQRGRRRSSC